MRNMSNINSPLISIIVPIYKVEAYLCRCVDSIISQTYTNLEIILVDDGSPDNCGKICDKYSVKDRRVKVIHKTNGGLSDARNVAITSADGEWITFVDSDDYVAQDYVATLYRIVERNKCKVGVASMRTFVEGEAVSTNQPDYEECVFDNLTGIEKMFYQELFDTTAWGKIYHRTLFSTGIRYPVGLLYEDLPTTYLLFLQSDRIAYCNRIVYNYQLRANSIEGQPFNVNKLDSAIKILSMIQAHSKDLKPITKSVRCRLLSFCLHILLEMPEDFFDERKQVLVDFVRNNRRLVMADWEARKKARLGALASYMGLKVSRRLLNMVKERKQ